MDMNALEFSDDHEKIVEYIYSNFYNRLVQERSDYFENMRDKDFHRRFRITKASVSILLEKIRPRLECMSTRSECISPMNQLLCTLRFYATGSQLITCGDFIGIHESTACRVIHRVTDAIARLYPQFIYMPRTEDELRNTSLEFYNIARFPRVIGAIDCTHVRMKSPGGDYAEIYRNRKGYFSFNVQAICSAKLVFSDVVARWHGSAHDSHIWDNSNQRRNFLQGTYGQHVLIGDSGYAQTAFMMTPLSTVINSAQSLYNESQIRTRNVVERVFGIWKRRFPILSRGIQVHISRIPGIVIATSILHNIAQRQGESEPPEDPEFSYCPDIDVQCLNPSNHSRSQNSIGSRTRLELIEYHFARL